ncbi:MAG: HAMP domain-containing sensor histidine kinase [Candidatus Omnitrophota bacterium]
MTWSGPSFFGVIVSVLSAVAWGVADLSSGRHYSNSLIPIWNTAMRLMIFLCTVYLTSRLKKALSDRGELPKRKFDFIGDIFHERKIEKEDFQNLVLAIMLVAMLGLTDYLAGYEISFSIFYFLPILFMTWFGPSFFGVIVSVLSAVAWGVADLSSGHHYSNSLIPIWNTAMRLMIFLCTVYLASRLKKALSIEKELSTRKSAFVANVSHELKNPLAVISESIALILDKIVGEVNEQQKEILEIGKQSADRLIRLVSDLLDLSQIEAGKMKLKREEVNLKVLVDGVLKNYEREISKKRLTLKKEIQQNIELLWGDGDKLTEVIINLLNNAIKYTPAGSITVKLTGNEREVRFEIADTGSGIPEEYSEKIFDKFERIMTEKQEGTGLGLPIAKDIIELHRGKLWVESEPGKGSRFIFTIPRDFRA